MIPFPEYARAFWRVSDKNRRMVPFVMNPQQQVVWAAMQRQVNAGRPIRLRILKARQMGMSLLMQLFCLYWVISRPSHQALSIANRLDLPAQWIRQLRRLLRQLKKQIRDAPVAKASTRQELYFEGALEGSRYLIGSALGETPGMGEILNGIHCSEIASWANPDVILGDLLPAVPPTADTFVVQESTGRAVGDWWYQRYYEAKEPDCEYDAVFLPWYLEPLYNRDIVEKRSPDNLYTWHDLGELDRWETETLAHAQRYQLAIRHLYKMPDITPGQMMWRRTMLRDEFHGNIDLFANQFPSCEIEAFLSEGVNIFTTEMVRKARETQRQPKKRYNIVFAKMPVEDDYGGFLPGPYESFHPRAMRLINNPSGELLEWKPPDDRYHYVIGADCMWGTRDTADFDCLFVQCLETNKIVAKVKGRYDLMTWGKIIAGMGFRYNNALVAPERNAQAANSVMPLLRGLVTDWAYPNIYVRSDHVSMKGHRPQDFGWLTTEPSKGELMAYAQTLTVGGEFDWCDETAIDQMQSYIRDERGKMTAPQGAHDDDLMARMITAYVSHLVRPMTDLHIERNEIEFVYRGTLPEDRLRWMAERNDPDYEELDGFE